MEPYLKRRILGAVFTVTALAIALPVVLDSTRHLELLETEVPPMPVIPDWAYEIKHQQVRQDAQALVSGEAEAQLQVADPQVASADSASTTQANTATEQPYAWTLQIGAFQDGANAQKLVDELRSKGFQAYSDYFAGEKLTRVYVGPELKQENIQALQRQLQQELGQQDIHIKRWLPGQ